MLPLSGLDLWSTPTFWIGLLFCTFPLNLLVYGWNDIADFEIDQFNPRKGNFLFGALSTRKQIERLPFFIIAIFLFSLAFLLLAAPNSIMLYLFLMLMVNWLYNKRKGGLRTRPPFELISQIGYLLIVPFSMAINEVDFIHPAIWVYLFLFAMQSHLMGEVMDIDSDRMSGRKTTATQIGMRKTKILIAFVIFKSNRYSLLQMKIFSLGSNVIAIATMIYVYLFGDKFF